MSELGLGCVSKSLQVSSYGCSVAKLEEVFLKVGEGDKGSVDGATKIDIRSRIGTIRNFDIVWGTSVTHPASSTPQGCMLGTHHTCMLGTPHPASSTPPSTHRHTPCGMRCLVSGWCLQSKMACPIPFPSSEDRRARRDDASAAAASRSINAVTDDRHDDGDDSDDELLIPLNGGSGRGGGKQVPRHTGGRLLLQQFRALFVKRFRNTSRSKLTACVQLVPPLAFTVLALILAETYFAVGESPSRTLTRLGATYGENTLLVNVPPSLSSAAATLTAPYAAMRSNAQRLALLNVSAGSQDGVNLFLAREATGAGTDHPGTTEAAYMFNQDDSARRSIVLVDFQPLAAASSRNAMHIGNATASTAVPAVTATGWFNGQGIHSVAEALALADAGLLAAYVGPGAWLEVANHPLPRTAQVK